MQLNQLISQLEQVSQLYAKRFEIERNDAWFLLKLSEELGELTQSYLKMSGQARNQDASAAELQQRFEDEVADVLGQILLLSNHHQIDLSAALQRKWLKYLPAEQVVKTS